MGIRKTISSLLTIIFLVITQVCLSQDTTHFQKKRAPEHNFCDKFYLGGNLGLQFGTVTFAEVSPLVGYKFTDKISAGVGITYQYYHYKDRTIDFTTNVYGGRVFGRYFFTNYLFAHVEDEYLNLEAFDFRRRRVDVNSLLAGGGYYQRFGPNSGISAMLLYNFTPTVYTPYTNPIFRIGIMVGI